MKAKFSGNCYWCGERITVGEEINHGPKGTGWCHALCAEALHKASDEVTPPKP